MEEPITTDIVIDESRSNKITIYLNSEDTRFLNSINEKPGEAVRLLIKKVKELVVRQNRTQYIQVIGVGIITLGIAFILPIILGYVFLAVAVAILGYGIFKLVRGR